MQVWTPSWKEFSGPDAVLPELPVVGWKAPRRALSGHYGPDLRTSRWTVIMRVRGAMAVSWHSPSNPLETVVIPSGHVLIIPPGVATCAESSALTPGVIGFFAFVDGPLPGLEPDVSRHLWRALRKLPRVCRCPAFFEHLILDLLAAHRAPPTPLHSWGCRLHLHRLLHALALLEKDSTSATPLPADMRRALTVMENTVQPLPVMALARAAGLEREAFTKRFALFFGTSPAVFMRARRMTQVKALLRQGASVTSIAMQLGFASSQHLADTFRRAVGVSATTWLKADQQAHAR